MRRLAPALRGAFPVVCLGMALATGCSEASIATFDADSQSAAGTPVPGSLRVDVLPPATADGLLPQTQIFSPSEWGSNFTFNLAPTVEITGTVFGDVAHPWTGFAPAQPEPLSATLTASGEGLLDGGATVTDPETGAFSLKVPAGRGYAFSVVPQNADTSPFSFEPDQAFMNDARNFSLSVEMGLPVYGRVTDADGTPIPGVPLRVERLIDGITVVAGATFTSDATGWYATRILPVEGASFRVAVVEGKAGGYLFASRAFAIALDRDVGAEVDVSVGPLERYLVRGDVVDADGDPVDAEVRLTSVLLAGGGGLTVETTAVDGTFFADVLPGTYQMEVYPPYEILATPVRALVEVVDAGVEHDIVLPAPTVLQGRVLDQEGRPVDGASISAAQAGFGGYRYKGTTGADGTFAMTVPDIPLEVTFSPRLPSEDGAITSVTMSPGGSVDVILAEGAVVSGAVTWQGAPLAYAVLQVLDARTGALLGFGVTDADGNVSLALDIPEESALPEADAADTGTGSEGSGDTGTGSDGSGDTGDVTGAGGDTGGDTGPSGGDSGGDTGASGGDTAAAY